MKKASFELGTEMMDWIFNLIIIIIVVGVIVLTIYLNSSRKIDTNGAELDTLKTYLIYSPSCLAYQDERVHPGIIDLQKFNDLDCFKKENLGINLTLKDLDGNVISSKIINKDIYKDNKPFCGLKTKTFDCFKKSEYVLINSGEIKKGELIFDVIIKHE